MVENLTIIVNGKLMSYASWTSPLLDNSLMNMDTDKTNWGRLTWEEENTDESNAFVRVDILDSTNAVIVSDLKMIPAGYIDLSGKAGVEDNDIKLKFKLYWTETYPIVKNISITGLYGDEKMTLTTTGKNYILKRLFDANPTQSATTQFGLGTGTANPTEEDTALGSKNYGYSNMDSGYPSYDTSNNKATLRATLDEATGNGLSFTEAGLVNTDVDPVLMSRATFTSIDKTAALRQIFEWVFTID
jgi:hypothetical protein